MTSSSPLPFPLIATDDHPSGCDDTCDYPLHLTAGALEVLRRGGVDGATITAALELELHAHARSRLYPSNTPPHWNDRIEACLEKLGVPPAVIEAAKEKVERREEKAARRATHAAASRSEYVRDWKTRNKERIAEHSRAYRARRRAAGLQVVK